MVTGGVAVELIVEGVLQRVMVWGVRNRVGIGVRVGCRFGPKP